jgi:hypothetical protein
VALTTHHELSRSDSLREYHIRVVS